MASIDPTKAALLQKLTGSDGSAAPTEMLVSNAPTANMLFGDAKTIRHKVAAPELERYWNDDQGNIWRRDPEPEVILTFQSNLTVAELNAVLEALLDQE